jgi:hypothetical protein
VEEVVETGVVLVGAQRRRKAECDKNCDRCDWHASHSVDYGAKRRAAKAPAKVHWITIH